MLWKLLIALFYLAGLLSAINAVMTARTAQGAVAWALSMITLPFIAVPAYWVFGRSKFQGFLEAYEDHQEDIDQLVQRASSLLKPQTLEPVDQHLSYAALCTMSGNRMTRNNRAELLINGEATFGSIFAGIQAAQQYVLVQFYTIRDDELGGALQELLIEKARQGLTVCVLYDEVGSLPLPQRYINELRDAGVNISGFNATRGWANRFQLNFRNHRKIVITDGRKAWLGGHNVGDAYMGRDPKLSPWRDTHVLLEGPIAQQLQAVFIIDWFWATRDLPELEWAPEPVTDSALTGMIIPTEPTQRLETAALMFVHALNRARQRIWISAPYFVPDGAVLSALQLAALRGVEVCIVVPGLTDNTSVRLAGFHYMMQLGGLGIKFYEYGNGMLHAKNLLIDDHTSMISTANFDNRSFRLNFEVTALLADEAFARQVEAMFEDDFAASTLIDTDALAERNFFWRLAVSVTRLASPIL